jgi:hypothetical protein
MGSDESDLRCGQCGSRLFMNHLESCPLGPGIVGQRGLVKDSTEARSATKRRTSIWLRVKASKTATSEEKTAAE